MVFSVWRTRCQIFEKLLRIYLISNLFISNNYIYELKTESIIIYVFYLFYEYGNVPNALPDWIQY